MAARDRNYELKKTEFIYLFTAENNILSCELFILPSLGLYRLGRQNYTHPTSKNASAITVTSE